MYYMLLCVECWDTVGATFEKCGVLKPSAPQNLFVTYGMVNTTHVILNVTWSPPERYAPTIKNYNIIIDKREDIINGVRLTHTLYI